jgi:hypothetical protein
MSDIDFQNGFICGMATKGLVRSGELYKPVCWNDSGVYDFFYINFKRGLSTFSLGMFNESIVVYDSEAVPVTGIEYVSNGLYKVYCDISNKTRGVTVINKKSTLLTTSNGYTLPVFSVIFYVEGLDTYIRRAYAYEKVELRCTDEVTILDNETTEFNEYIQRAIATEVVEDWSSLNVSDSADISYWIT